MRKFTGSLLKPITISTQYPTLLTDNAAHRQECETYNRAEIIRAVTDQLGKLEELRVWLELPEKTGDSTTDWAFLALSLASKFVPGFRIKNLTIEKSRGRQKEWNWEKYTQLLADTELLQRERQRTDSEACTHLTKDSRFRPRWSKYEPRTLKNKLIEARQEEKNIVMLIAKRTKDLSAISDGEFLDILIDIFSLPKKRN